MLTRTSPIGGTYTMDPNRLWTKSLRTSPIGDQVVNILAKALDAVDPAKAINQYMQRNNSKLRISNHSYDLEAFNRVFLIGFGKASIPMAESAIKILGNFLFDGLIITKGNNYRSELILPILEGAHPVPDQRSIDGAKKIKQLLSSTTKKDLVIFLISGGGSSLLTLPVIGITLDQIQTMTKILLACGATINEINCLRKHLSQVKGGQLARIASPAQITSLILSDVIDDPLDVIASGPTVPDPSTFSDAFRILDKYEIIDSIPVSIKVHLNRGINGDIFDTPKSDDPIFENVQNTVIGNNYQAAKAALVQAKKYGFNTLLLTTSLQGEARVAGKFIAAIAKQIAATGEPIPRPVCIIAGGETTVTVRGKGLGGRNQEFALGAVNDIAGLKDTLLITLATDGDDGPTYAAGAVVTGETREQAKLYGNIPSEFLNRNASYEFFDPLKDLLKPGMTDTNVNDLIFLIQY